MATLLDTLKQREYKSQIKFMRAASDLGISAAALERWITSEEFFLMRVPVSRLSIHYGEIFAAKDVSSKGMIVIDVNKRKVGKTGSGFVPKAIVYAGIDHIAKIKKTDTIWANCWVGRDAMKALGLRLKDDMAIDGELPNKLTKLVRAQYPNQFSYLVEITASSVTFSVDGDKYRQTYSATNKNALGLYLTGEPSRLFAQEPAQVVRQGAGAVPGHQVGWTQGAPNQIRLKSDDLPDVDGTYFGPKGNTLNNLVLQDDLSNIENTLDQYLYHLRDGSWKPVSSQWATIPLEYAGTASRVKLAASQMGIKNFAVMDFYHWQRAIKAAAKEE